MGRVLQFKSCAYGGEYNGLGARTPTSYYFVAPATSEANFQNQIDSTYLNDPLLSGKVTAIGYGWQKYEVPTSGKAKFTVRGAAGGATGQSGYSINAITGTVTGSGNRPGRGAKLVGTTALKKGDILYILVGIRGWCNDGSDWGGSGGGASVVLKDNPAGAYTFAPLNRKVDVLFVAGGGGGTFDSSYGSQQYYGGDAVASSNGTNTNGGSAGSDSGCGGGGLTGNGTKSNGPHGGLSLLSGSIPTTSLNAIHYGAWGGGGASYDGGGGGGGYSGGAVSGNNYGGQGGTSYINPSLCIAEYRGYATVADDGNRNLTNPWTAYGFVEIEFGRNPQKYILAQDSDGYKYFYGSEKVSGDTALNATNRWELLSDQSVPTQQTYELYGNYIITNTDGLNYGIGTYNQETNVRFLISSPEPTENIKISSDVNAVTLEMANDVSIADVSTLTSIVAETNLKNAKVTFAVSKDRGKSWQTYSTGSGWIDAGQYLNSRQDFIDGCCEMKDFATIPIADWNSYNAKTIRFKFCISTNGSTGSNSILKSIKIVADLIGSWRHYLEEEATYEYISDGQVKITFKKGGNYKVNYLDSIGS